jgi:uncharacterized protein YjbI with pentapeptide repeats
VYQSRDGEDAMKWLRSWWKKAKKPLEIFIVTGGCLAVIVLVVFIILTYIYNWNVPGLRGKNLWDWLQLLIIPVVLAVGGYVYNYTTSRNEQKATQLRDQTERNIAQDNQQEAALQEYINKMSELLLEKDLRKSSMDAEVRTIAHVRTLTVLHRLNGERKGDVLRFLGKSGLIIRGKSIIDLQGAFFTDSILDHADLSGSDLSGAEFSFASLQNVNLENTDLTGTFFTQADMTCANLRRANLTDAILARTKLSRANLSEANLSGATLDGAALDNEVRVYTLRDGKWTPIKYGQITILKGAKVTQEQLNQASTLEGAIMPDGTKHA